MVPVATNPKLVEVINREFILAKWHHTQQFVEFVDFLSQCDSDIPNILASYSKGGSMFDLPSNPDPIEPDRLNAVGELYLGAEPAQYQQNGYNVTGNSGKAFFFTKIYRDTVSELEHSWADFKAHGLSLVKMIELYYQNDFSKLTEVIQNKSTEFPSLKSLHQLHSLLQIAQEKKVYVTIAFKPYIEKIAEKSHVVEQN